MRASHNLTLEERRADLRKIWRAALLVSLLLHVLVFLLWRSNGPLMSPFAAAGPRAGDNRAAGGAMQSMAIRIPPPQPIVPPLIPLPTVTPDIVEFEPEVEPSSIDVLGDRPGNAPGPPGLEGGTGKGDGGTAEEGLFRLVPPSPRGMIMPPANDRLKGREVEVWVFVNEQGRVVPDSTRLKPPTSDGDFNRRLIQEAAQWVFEPARKGGKAVASWFPYTIAM